MIERKKDQQRTYSKGEMELFSFLDNYASPFAKQEFAIAKDKEPQHHFIKEIIERQNSAKSLLQNYGFPSRRQEAWHYLDLRSLFTQFAPKQFAANSSNMEQRACERLERDKSIKENNYCLLEAENSAWDGAAIKAQKPIEAYGFGQDFKALACFLKHKFERDDFIGQLNNALITKGLRLELKANQEKTPIIELRDNIAQYSNHSGLAVNGGANSHYRFIQSFNFHNYAIFQSHITNISLEQNAVLDWVIYSDEQEQVTQFLQYNAELKKGSRLNIYLVQRPYAINRKEFNIELNQEGAQFHLYVINLLGANSQSNIVTNVKHKAPASLSREYLRNIALGRASGSFQGLIHVAPGAQKVDAKMSCKSLILSHEASFFAKPELEIFADDVSCGHGATIAQLDRAALFYLMARGIAYDRAKILLLEAFLSELLDDMEDEALRHFCQEKMQNWHISS